MLSHSLVTPQKVVKLAQITYHTSQIHHHEPITFAIIHLAQAHVPS